MAVSAAVDTPPPSAGIGQVAKLGQTAIVDDQALVVSVVVALAATAVGVETDSMKRFEFEQKKDRTIVRSLRSVAFRSGGLLFILSLFATLSGWAAAPEQPKTFSSPEDAARAMVEALNKDDRPGLITIFGQESRGLLTSGDPVEDKNTIQTFLKDYNQMHRFSRGPGGKLFLIVGAENWPMPIPLVRNAAGWHFDTPYGKRELLFRRIGENEFSAMKILKAIVVGQHEYFNETHDNGASKEYAQKILSDDHTHDGLYWKTSSGERESPIGPLVAQATEEGYGANPRGKPVRGYYFKILTKQGSDAPGGAKSYVVDGKMKGGFAVLAYPAAYRSSGVMTFLADSDGNILQKDLGPQTEELARAMDTYNPNKTWQSVQ